MGAEPGVVTIRDYGSRDGLRGEAPLPVAERETIANGLAAAGVSEVEAVSFVSPRAVPAMAGAADVGRLLVASGTVWWALVPNLRGCELALEAGFDHLTVTVSASSVYSEKNTGMSIGESLEQLARIRKVAGDAVIDAVVSFSFGSPYGDGVDAVRVGQLAADVRAIGVDWLTLADTTPHRCCRRAHRCGGGAPPPRHQGHRVDQLVRGARARRSSLRHLDRRARGLAVRSRSRWEPGDGGAGAAARGPRGRHRYRSRRPVAGERIGVRSHRPYRAESGRLRWWPAPIRHVAMELAKS